MAGTGPGSAGRSRREEGHEVWKVKDKAKPSEGWWGLVLVSLELRVVFFDCFHASYFDGVDDCQRTDALCRVGAEG